ncbi:hypothetical protein JCM9279_002477 [Rhodotorula babjevae]
MPLPSTAFYSTAPARAAHPAASWDDDDEWDPPYDRPQPARTEQEHNIRLWQDANTARPLYSILPSSSAPRAVPPPAALDTRTTNGPPKLTILKRPTAAAPATASSRTSSAEGRARTDKSLKDREREYAEARRRIYGEQTPTSSTGGAVATAASSRSASPASSSAGSRTAALARSVEGLSLGKPAGPVRARPSGSSGSGASPQRAADSARPSTATSRSRTRSQRDAAAPQPGTATTRAPKGPNGDSGGFGYDAAASEGRRTGGGGSHRRGTHTDATTTTPRPHVLDSRDVQRRRTQPARTKPPRADRLDAALPAPPRIAERVS